MLDYLHFEKLIFTKNKSPNSGINMYTLLTYFKLKRPLMTLPLTLNGALYNFMTTLFYNFVSISSIK